MQYRQIYCFKKWYFFFFLRYDFQCYNCKKSFESSKYLRLHIKASHPKLLRTVLLQIQNEVGDIFFKYYVLRNCNYFQTSKKVILFYFQALVKTEPLETQDTGDENVREKIQTSEYQGKSDENVRKKLDFENPQLIQ